jgi:hypothetical protein
LKIRLLKWNAPVVILSVSWRSMGFILRI